MAKRCSLAEVVAVSYSRLIICSLVTCLQAADKDPLQDFCVAASPQQQQHADDGAASCRRAALQGGQRRRERADFVSSHLRTARLQSQQLGMAVSLADAAAFPGLDTQGISMARIEFQPRGLNPPHVHPRATPNRGHSLRQATSSSSSWPPPIPVQFRRDRVCPCHRGLQLSEPRLLQAHLLPLRAAQPPLPDEVLQTALGIDDQHDIDGLIASVARALE
ncbi:hypothetical protein L7F22_007399 [Adiantum nelumboides]|nr:hypothetical protein [Adiantum nelumboides]